MKESKTQVLFYIGILILVFSYIAAFLKIYNWYFPAVIGAFLVFDSRTNKSTLNIFFSNKKKFLKIYLAMLALGLSIEATGRYLLHLWYYPYINSLTHEILLFLFYPFILISFREMYNSVNKVVKNRLSFILTMLLGILLWEVPNLFSGDWIYSFPGPGLVGINPIFILGWILLIGLPVFIFNEYLDV